MDLEKVEALERIADLKRRGLLDDHEVEQAKREILSRTPAESSEVSVAGDPPSPCGGAPGVVFTCIDTDLQIPKLPLRLHRVLSTRDTHN